MVRTEWSKEKAELDKVFVYGTLKKGFSNHPVIPPYCKGIQSAALAGLLFDLPYGYPAAIDGEGIISGEVLELSRVEEALAELDNLEDYYGPGCADNLYDRVVREAILTNGSKVTVYVYLWNKPNELAKLGMINPQGSWGGNTGLIPH